MVGGCSLKRWHQRAPKRASRQPKRRMLPLRRTPAPSHPCRVLARLPSPRTHLHTCARNCASCSHKRKTHHARTLVARGSALRAHLEVSPHEQLDGRRERLSTVTVRRSRGRIALSIRARVAAIKHSVHGGPKRTIVEKLERSRFLATNTLLISC